MNKTVHIKAKKILVIGESHSDALREIFDDIKSIDNELHRCDDFVLYKEMQKQNSEVDYHSDEGERSRKHLFKFRDHLREKRSRSQVDDWGRGSLGYGLSFLGFNNYEGNSMVRTLHGCPRFRLAQKIGHRITKKDILKYKSDLVAFRAKLQANADAEICNPRVQPWDGRMDEDGLARDVKIATEKLNKEGYKVTSVQPITTGGFANVTDGVILMAEKI